MKYEVTSTALGPALIGLPTLPRKRTENIDSLGNIVSWGSDNLYPQNIYAAGKANSMIPAIIEKQIGLIAGSGFTYGLPKRGPEGLSLVFSDSPKLEQYLLDINVEDYIIRAFTDLLWFGNFFPFVKKSGTEIVGLSIQEAMFCRMHKQNKNGLINKVTVNANWDLFAQENDSDSLHYTVLQRGGKPADQLSQLPDGGYIYPMSMNSPGAVFYQACSWHSVQESGWLPYANKLVAINNAILDNQISVKYIIEIANKYWELRFPDWHQMPELQKSRIGEVKLEIESGLAGVDNAGKAIFTTGLYPEHNDVATKMISLITVTPLKDFLKGGDNIGSSQEAAAHISIALGMPAALLGNTPGNGGNGASSGSNIFEALRLFLQHFSIYGNLILEPLNRLVLPYMGFQEKIQLLQPAMLKREALSPDKR